MGVFIHMPKSKLLSLQDTTFCPENSSLPSAELSFFEAPGIREKKKKRKAKGRLGHFRDQGLVQISLKKSVGKKEFPG